MVDNQALYKLIRQAGFDLYHWYLARRSTAPNVRGFNDIVRRANSFVYEIYRTEETYPDIRRLSRSTPACFTIFLARRDCSSLSRKSRSVYLTIRTTVPMGAQ